SDLLRFAGHGSTSRTRSAPRRHQARAAGCERPVLPCDGALLGGVHVLLAAALEEERFHVLRQKAARLRIHHVEAVVIDQHGLLFQPESPALLAEALDDAGPDRARKGRTFETGACLTTTHAGDGARHETSRIAGMPNLYLKSRFAVDGSRVSVKRAGPGRPR